MPMCLPSGVDEESPSLGFVSFFFALGLAEFIFLTHNYLRCLQLVFLAPVGDVIQGKGKVCFSSSESLSA